MMNLSQAITYGKHIGVRYYVVDEHGHIYAGTKTREQAEASKRRYEIEERNNPFRTCPPHFQIREA